jgi:hypothetical protein
MTLTWGILVRQLWLKHESITKLRESVYRLGQDGRRNNIGFGRKLIVDQQGIRDIRLTKSYNNGIYISVYADVTVWTQ